MGDDYSIQRLLLRGGHFGVIYVMKNENRDLMLLRVAFITANMSPKVNEELDTVKELNHPNILKLLGYHLDQDKQMVFLVNQMCPSVLSDKITEIKGSVDVQLVTMWFSQMAEGLKFLHSKQILHRDIRPNNIFLIGEELVKLGNVGLNRDQETMAHQSLYCKTSEETPCYMGPEIFEKNSNYLNKTDIWSLGCVFYEVLKGKPAFTYKNISALLNEEPETISYIWYRDLQSIIRSMLEKLLCNRPSAYEVVDKIKAVSKAQGIFTDCPQEDSVVDMSGVEPDFQWEIIAQMVRDEVKRGQSPVKRGSLFQRFRCQLL